MTVWNDKPRPVSVVLRFSDPTPEERRRANAYFGELSAAAELHRGNKQALQAAWDAIWRKYNGGSSEPVAKPATASLWAPSPPAPAWNPQPPKIQW